MHAARLPLRSLSPLVALLASFATTALAQGPPGCTAPESRQFDFWAGSWTVTTPQGAVAGTNTIESILDGCVLQEHWVGSKGGSGTSLNLWDAASGSWRQVWVDASGGMLELSGKLVGKQMILSGTSKGPGGSTGLNRITWTPRADGTVRQLWESSADNGATWTVQFDGIYTRQP